VRERQAAREALMGAAGGLPMTQRVLTANCTFSDQELTGRKLDEAQAALVEVPVAHGSRGLFL
jgi:hypothetical protein